MEKKGGAESESRAAGIKNKVRTPHHRDIHTLYRQIAISLLQIDYIIKQQAIQQNFKGEGMTIYKSQTISNWDKLPVVLDIHIVALIFDVTEVTIKRWIYKGALKGTKTGNKWVFDKEYIKALISGNMGVQQ